MLGIETSCDETAAAVVRRAPDGGCEILSEALISQLEEHRPFGGVVPEIAARAHLSYLDGLIARAMADAGLDYDDLDGIAATGGPGLIGGVMVGVLTAKAIAAVRGLPFIAQAGLELGDILDALQQVGFQALEQRRFTQGDIQQVLIQSGIEIERSVGHAYSRCKPQLSEPVYGLAS